MHTFAAVFKVYNSYTYAPLCSQNDRETLQRIQMGDIDFDYELWSNISREAKHFVANLLVYKQVTTAPSNPGLATLQSCNAIHPVCRRRG